jgi:hypothetical protein
MRFCRRRQAVQTTRADVERVMDEVATGLEQGTFARPAQAVFLGRQL